MMKASPARRRLLIMASMRGAFRRVAPALIITLGVSLPVRAQQQPPPAPPYGHYPPQYPPQYPPPPAQPPPPPKDDKPRVIEPWEPDDPPPEGYVLRSKVNGGAIAGGATLLGVMWLTSIVVGAVAATEEDDQGIDGDGVESEDFAPMYVPIVGPFVTIGTVEPGSAGLGMLIVDGILQVSGAGLIVLGIVDRDYRVVRGEAASLQIVPALSPRQSGLTAVATF